MITCESGQEKQKQIAILNRIRATIDRVIDANLQKIVFKLGSDRNNSIFEFAPIRFETKTIIMQLQNEQGREKMQKVKNDEPN